MKLQNKYFICTMSALLLTFVILFLPINTKVVQAKCGDVTWKDCSTCTDGFTVNSTWSNGQTLSISGHNGGSHKQFVGSGYRQVGCSNCGGSLAEKYSYCCECEAKTKVCSDTNAANTYAAGLGSGYHTSINGNKVKYSPVHTANPSNFKKGDGGYNYTEPHTPVSNDIAATCTTTGTSGRYTCSKCATVTTPGTTTPALGHAWPDWTTTSSNIRYKNCTRCSTRLATEYYFSITATNCSSSFSSGWYGDSSKSITYTPNTGYTFNSSKNNNDKKTETINYGSNSAKAAAKKYTVSFNSNEASKTTKGMIKEGSSVTWTYGSVPGKATVAVRKGYEVVL